MITSSFWDSFPSEGRWLATFLFILVMLLLYFGLTIDCFNSSGDLLLDFLNYLILNLLLWRGVNLDFYSLFSSFLDFSGEGEYYLTSFS